MSFVVFASAPGLPAPSEDLPAYEPAPAYAETSPSAGLGYTLANETRARACALNSRAILAKHYKEPSQAAADAARTIANAVWGSAARYGFRSYAAQAGLERLSKIVEDLDGLFTEIESLGVFGRNLHRAWYELQLKEIRQELRVLERELEIDLGYHCGVLQRAFEESGAMRRLAPCPSAASSASSSSNPWLRPEQISAVSWMTRQ